MTAPATFYAVHGPNGDLTWRVTGPADLLGAKLSLIPEAEGEDLAWPNTGEHFPWQVEAQSSDASTVLDSRESWEAFNRVPRSLTDLRVVYPAQVGDAAVFTRPMSWLAVHGLQLRRNGVRVVAECDDNYLAPSHLNTFMQASDYGDRDRDAHARSICSADAIVFSTDHLRDHYARLLRDIFRGSDLPELLVARNHVDERHIPAEKAEPVSGRLRVGFMGSPSHMWDIDLIWPALKACHDLGHDVYMIGMDPLLSPVSEAKLGSKYWRRLAARWGSIRYTHIPWRLDYRGTALPLDIGLAPLVTNEYTLCKSDIKWLEYAMSGAACVAQNNLVFNRTAVHGETALLAGSPEEFLRQTLALVNYRDLREKLVANTMQYVREERLLADHRNEWEQAVLG